MFLNDIKNITKDIFYYSGIADSIISALKGRLCILCYHRITRPGSGFKYLGVPQDVFEEHILFLMRHFCIVSFDEAIERFKAKAKGKPLLVLTFDDGYRDNYLYAFPVLKKYQLVGTIFLTADYIGTEQRFWWDRVADIAVKNTGLKEKGFMIDEINLSLKKLREEERERRIEDLRQRFGCSETSEKERDILSWDEIKEMAGYGIDFGSHTLTHPDLTLLKEGELRKEISRSKEVLEGVLKRNISGFSYPYGFYNDDVKGIVRESSYSYARTGSNGFNSYGQDVFALRRIDGLVYKVSHLASRLSYRVNANL